MNLTHESQTRSDLLAIFVNSGLNTKNLEFEPGTMLYEHGSPPGGLLFIMSGRVRTFLPVGQENIEIEKIGPGQCMGLPAVISGENSELSAMAENKVNAVFISRNEVSAALLANPRLYLAINPFLSEAVSCAYKHIRKLRSVRQVRALA